MEFLFNGQWLDESDEGEPFSRACLAQRWHVFLRVHSVTKNFTGIIFRSLAGALKNREI